MNVQLAIVRGVALVRYNFNDPGIGCQGRQHGSKVKSPFASLSACLFWSQNISCRSNVGHRSGIELSYALSTAYQGLSRINWRPSEMIELSPINFSPMNYCLPVQSHNIKKGNNRYSFLAS